MENMELFGNIEKCLSIIQKAPHELFLKIGVPHQMGEFSKQTTCWEKFNLRNTSIKILNLVHKI